MRPTASQRVRPTRETLSTEADTMRTTGQRTPATDAHEPAPEAPFLPGLDSEATFEAAFQASHDRIEAVCELVLGDRRRADRVAARAMLRAHRTWHRVDGSRRPTVHIYREVFGSGRARVRRFRDRSSRRRRPGPRSWTLDGSDLGVVFAALDERTRAVLVLSDVEALSPSEVSVATGSATASMQSRLEAARDAAIETGAFEDDEALREALRRACVDTPAAVHAWARHLREYRRSTAIRRVATIASVGVVALGVALAVSRGGADSEAGSATGSSSTASDESLAAGTYRLPGLSVGVSVSLPEGWRAGDSVWGPDGPGFAAITTGPRTASVGIAIFDLSRLRPIDVSATPPRAAPHPVAEAWFEAFRPRYERLVEPRIRDRVVGRRLEWRPPPLLAWLLTHTDRGPIEIADDVPIADRNGSLVSFRFPGPGSELLRVPGSGTIDLRPGMSYTFWVPRGDDRVGRSIMVGIARELGAVAGTAEWEVIRTLELGA
jgi:DNA-directed RNA polymerase specialized sigma24 family protein